MTQQVETQTITNRQWDGAVARIEKKNLAMHGQTPTRATISRLASHFIHEVNSDGTMVVTKGWREALNSYGLIKD